MGDVRYGNAVSRAAGLALSLVVTSGVMSGWCHGAEAIAAPGSKLAVEGERTITAADLTVERVGTSIPVAAIGEPVSEVKLNAPKWVDGPNGGYGVVEGTMLPIDPKAKAINFRVALPAKWARRSAQMGGAGFNGAIPNVTGGELGQGFATYGSDSGHQWGPDDWAVNDEVIRNFGYMQMKKTHDARIPDSPPLRASPKWAIAAADVRPEQASTILHAALNRFFDTDDRRQLAIAIFRHAQDSDLPGLAHEFYAFAPASGARPSFLQETRRINPQRYRLLVALICEDSRLDELGVASLRELLQDNLAYANEPPLPEEQLRDSTSYDEAGRDRPFPKLQQWRAEVRTLCRKWRGRNPAVVLPPSETGLHP